MVKKLASLSLTISLLLLSGCPNKKDIDEMLLELAEGKQSASRLVTTVLSSSPSERDLQSLKNRYEFAKDSYEKWALEAATAVRRGDDIRLDSERAKNAHNGLEALASFATEYAERRKREDKASGVTNLNGAKLWAIIKAVAKEVQKNWPTIEKTADVYKKWRKAAQEKRDKYADQIEAAGKWPAFKDIPTTR